MGFLPAVGGFSVGTLAVGGLARFFTGIKNFLIKKLSRQNRKLQPDRTLTPSLCCFLAYSGLHFKQAHLMPVLFFFLLLYIFLFNHSIRKVLKKL